MAFNPITLLDSIGVEHKVRGDNVYFRCPVCGDSDLGSDNFGMRLDGRAWGCWRDRSHNLSLRNLIRALTGWSFDQVREYLGGSSATSPISDLRKRLARLRTAPKVERVERLRFPREFEVPRPKGSTARFFRYFERRGFPEVEALIRRFGIRCARSGEFHDRVILPVWVGERLFGWTARAIGEAEVRYLAHPGSVKDAVFGVQALPRPLRLLVIVEGPFDALKLAWAARLAKLPVGVISLMGTYATATQAAQVASLAAGGVPVAIVLDRAARGPARRLRKAMPRVRAHVRPLPAPWKDPGDMTIAAAQAFLRGLLAA